MYAQSINRELRKTNIILRMLVPVISSKTKMAKYIYKKKSTIAEGR